jgi:hypothetical protein
MSEEDEYIWFNAGDHRARSIASASSALRKLGTFVRRHECADHGHSIGQHPHRDRRGRSAVARADARSSQWLAWGAIR